jgi:hypothetical protein
VAAIKSSKNIVFYDSPCARVCFSFACWVVVFHDKDSQLYGNKKNWRIKRFLVKQEQQQSLMEKPNDE